MTIYLATDHAGFELKEKVNDWLVKNGYEVKDFGAFKFDEKDDYPDFVKKAAEAVTERGKGKHPHSVIASGAKQSDKNLGKIAAAPLGSRNDGCRAIIFGGSGQGEAMVANRYKGVRAAVVYKYDEDIIKLSREHNDANVLSFGARFIKEKDALKAVKLWLETSFSGDERHIRRILKID